MKQEMMKEMMKEMKHEMMKKMKEMMKEYGSMNAMKKTYERYDEERRIKQIS